MFLFDAWAEQHILDAQKKGEFDNLPGMGAPLVLDDDSAVPAELRTAFRLLKNAGYLPAQLQARKEALEIRDLLREIAPENAQHEIMIKRLRLLELQLQQAGMSTDFLSGEYLPKLHTKMQGKADV
jgi:hypothetical protein